MCSFMPADTLWTTAMAINVYLTFFKKYDRDQLRALEWIYFILCYGVPFVPALTYLFVRLGEPSQKIYGPAVVSEGQKPCLVVLRVRQVWCWISRRWAALRLATFYGQVW